MCLAVPGEIVEIIEGADPYGKTARVSFGGIIKSVSLAYVPEAKLGDFVIVHVGFALQIVDADEARAIFDQLREMGELAELEQA
jgi:hydrogenase expression/formation protein HypC